MLSEKHATAIIETQSIGIETTISAFVHVLPNAVIGSNCIIRDHVIVGAGAVIGNRVSIESGAKVRSGVILEDDVQVGPNATLIESTVRDRAADPASNPPTVVRRGATIGASAVVLPGVTVGMHALVGAGAVVTKHVPPSAIVVGNPARIVGYVPSHRPLRPQVADHTAEQRLPEIAIPGVKLHRMPIIKDLRGTLSFGQYDQHLPFPPKRYFITYDVSDFQVRGEHAHRECHQFLVCVKGFLSVVVDDGAIRDEVLLDNPGIGLHVPPMVWATQYKYSPDAVLLVLTSDVYTPEDYIRDYDEYLHLRRAP